MILVFLGTQDKPFDRLLNKIDELIDKKIIKDKVIAQVGITKYKGNNIEVFDFKDKNEINDLINEADLIITHGGVGTITDCIKQNKKVIVVPRLKKYDEHTNDHQVEITKEFDKLEYIIPVYKLNDLEEKIKESKKFKPLMYKSNNENFKNKLTEYIDSL